MYVESGSGSSEPATVGGVSDYSVVGDYVCADKILGDGSSYAVALDELNGETLGYKTLPCLHPGLFSLKGVASGVDRGTPLVSDTSFLALSCELVFS